MRAAPGASRAAIAGARESADGPRLIVRVTAAPEKGKANAAVIALLAKALGVPKSALRLTAGETDRNKTILIEGDPRALAARLDALSGESP